MAALATGIDALPAGTAALEAVFATASAALSGAGTGFGSLAASILDAGSNSWAATPQPLSAMGPQASVKAAGKPWLI
jgi:hypothetical protein